MEEIDIRTLLPHRDPVVMVDRLLAADERMAATALEVRADNIFVEDGFLKPYAMMEVMAQTCAAQLGYADKYIFGYDEVKIGYVGSVKNMWIDAAPKVGEILTTRVHVTEDFGDMRMTAAECYIEERRVAAAELVIALAKEMTTL